MVNSGKEKVIGSWRHESHPRIGRCQIRRFQIGTLAVIAAGVLSEGEIRQLSAA
ncbi:hypothetical protein RISK_003376 [Rhodopirellula islandica]|uniref:Uncharacterized protein n=1 Tax=Rhodopirellula islandica TaxID=595434 RepID=A0A0J1BCI9_RHOIS|nr:hypothetical protein RISK_003376 [Rhodopirellula islandica]